MKPIIKHKSAANTHYDKEAKYYDTFNEVCSKQTNQLIENILSKYKVETVLDLTCGTGSQVFWLTEKGFKVTGIDINQKMLDIAYKKAKEKNLNIHFEIGDIRNSKVGIFDSVLSIFNSIGHLTKADFELALQNINENLKSGGYYIFDIFNLEYLLDEDNITKLTIDWQKKSDHITTREIQYSTISDDGVLASYDIYHEQEGKNAPKISTGFQTLQVYSADQLKILLNKYGFEVVQQISIDGLILNTKKSERILTIARKISA